jgi:hypothetical protein
MHNNWMGDRISNNKIFILSSPSSYTCFGVLEPL